MLSCAKPNGRDALSRRVALATVPLLGLLVASVAFVSQVAADEGEATNRLVSTAERPSGAKLNKLIAQLGDETFAVREEATEQLIRLGIEAKPLLLAALSSSDAEVRFRAKHVLEVVVEGDFQRRLKAFEDDVDGSRGTSMPGWSAFKQFLGEDRHARSLFVELQRAEPQLLEAYGNDPKSAAKALAERVQLLQVNSNVRIVNRLNRNFFSAAQLQPTVGTSLAMLLVGGDEDVAVKDEVADRFRTLLTPQDLRTALLAGDARSDLCRKIVGRWIRREVSESATVNNLSAALQLNLPEGIEPAVRVLKNENSKGSVRCMAALIIANHGGKEHLPLIEPMLDDKERLFNVNVAIANLRIAGVPNNQAVPANRVPLETQTRDVALVVALKLMGQNPADFGFKMLTPADQRQLQLQAAQLRMGFPNDEERLAAFKKWEDWRKSQQQAAVDKPQSGVIER